MLLFLSLLGIFLSVIFLSFNARKNAATLYLGSFFFLVSLYTFGQYGLLYSKSVSLVTGLLIAAPIIFPPLFLTGPMLFLYVRSVLIDDARLRRRDFFHFLPTLIHFSAALPFALLPVSEKAELASQVVSNVGIMQIYTASLLSEILPVSAIYLSRPVLILAYTIWSAVLIAKYFAQNKLRDVFSGQNFMIKWLIILTGFVMLLSTSHIIDIAHTFKIHFSDMAAGLNTIRILSIFGLLGLMISPFLFPAILYGLPRLPAAATDKTEKTGKVHRGSTIKSHNHFKNTYLQSIGHQMDAFMQEHQPYLQPQFNINQLAVQLKVPAHHLAYYFREVKKQTFSEYRNRWRIQHAKKLLIEGKSSVLTLEAIASLSGFSNRDSFRSVFQKTEGVCPSSFLLQNKDAN
jgi:AraC-like DNA-binding protein